MEKCNDIEKIIEKLLLDKKEKRYKEIEKTYEETIIILENDNKFNELLSFLEKLKDIFQDDDVTHFYKIILKKLCKLTQIMAKHEMSLKYWRELETISSDDDVYIALVGIIDICKNCFLTMTDEELDLLRLCYYKLIRLTIYPDDFDYEGWCQEAIKFVAKHGPVDYFVKECMVELGKFPDDYQTLEVLCRFHINTFPDSFLEDSTPEFMANLTRLETLHVETGYKSFVVSLVEAHKLFVSDKDYASALAILMEAYLDNNQSYPEIHYYLARVYMTVRDIGSAERLVEEGLLTIKHTFLCFQQRFWDHFTFLRCKLWYLKQNDHDDRCLKNAIQTLEKLNASGTISPGLVEKELALCYIKGGMMEQATQAVEKYGSTLGRDQQYQYLELLGIGRYHSGDYPSAMLNLLGAIAQEPYPVLCQARIYIARMMVEDSKISPNSDNEPLEYLFNAVEIDPYSPRAFYYMALAYLAETDDGGNILHTDEARQCMERACDLYEYQNFDVGQRLADLYVDSNDLLSYHHILLKLFFVLEDLPRDHKISWVHRRLGIYYLQVGDFEEAIRSFTQVFHHDQNDIISWKCLAHAYFYNKSYKAALRAFTEVMILIGKEGEGHGIASFEDTHFYESKMATIYFKMGDHDKAIHSFESILFRCPDYKPAILGLAEAYVDLAKASVTKHADRKAAECVTRALGLLCRGLLRTNSSHTTSQSEADPTVRAGSDNPGPAHPIVTSLDPLKLCYTWNLLGDACNLLHPLAPTTFRVDSTTLLGPGEDPKSGHQPIRFFRSLRDCPSELSLLDLLLLSERAYTVALCLKPGCLPLWRKVGQTLLLTHQLRVRLGSTLAKLSCLAGLGPDGAGSSLARQTTNAARSGRNSSWLDKVYTLVKKWSALTAASRKPDKYFLNMLGVVAASSEINDYGLAHEAFSSCIALDSQDPIFSSNMGVLYLLQSNVKLSNEHFTNAQIIDPKYPQAWIGQATLAETVGKYEDAIDLYQHTYNMAYDEYNVISCGQSLFKLFCREMDRPSHQLQQQHQPQSTTKILTHTNWQDDDAARPGAARSDAVIRIRKILNYAAIQLDASAQIMDRLPVCHQIFYLHSQLSFLLYGYGGHDPVGGKGYPESGLPLCDQFYALKDPGNSCSYRGPLYHSRRALEIYLVTTVSRLQNASQQQLPSQLTDGAGIICQLMALLIQSAKGIKEGSLSKEELNTLRPLLEYYCFLLSCSPNQASVRAEMEQLSRDFAEISRTVSLEKGGGRTESLTLRCVLAFGGETVMGEGEKSNDVGRNGGGVVKRLAPNGDTSPIADYDMAKLNVLDLVHSYLNGTPVETRLKNMAREEFGGPVATAGPNPTPKGNSHKTKGSTGANSKKSSQSHQEPATNDTTKFYSSDFYMCLTVSLLQLLTGRPDKAQERIDNLKKSGAAIMLRGLSEQRSSYMSYAHFASSSYLDTLEQELKNLLRNQGSGGTTAPQLVIPTEAIEIMCHRPVLLLEYSHLFERPDTRSHKPELLMVMVHLMLGNVTPAYKLAQTLYHADPTNPNNKIVLSVAAYGRAIFSGHFDAVKDITEACLVTAIERSQGVKSPQELTVSKWLWQWYAFVDLSSGSWKADDSSHFLSTIPDTPDYRKTRDGLRVIIDNLSLLLYVGNPGKNRIDGAFMAKQVPALRETGILTDYSLGNFLASVLVRSFTCKVRAHEYNVLECLEDFLASFYQTVSNHPSQAGSLLPGPIDGGHFSNGIVSRHDPPSASVWSLPPPKNAGEGITKPLLDKNGSKGDGKSPKLSETDIRTLYLGYLPPLFQFFWWYATSASLPLKGYKASAFKAFRDLLKTLMDHCRNQERDTLEPALTKTSKMKGAPAGKTNHTVPEKFGPGQVLLLETLDAFSSYLTLQTKDCTYEGQVRDIVHTYLRANYPNVYPFDVIKEAFDHVLISNGNILLLQK